MTITRGRETELADSHGRSPLHPEWSGDVVDLTNDELSDRIQHLTGWIGHMTTEYMPETREWRIRPDWQDQVALAVRARLVALMEYETRREMSR